MDNRRKSLWVEFVKSAQLASGDGTIVRQCQVRDLSSRGAKIVLPDHTDLPDDLILHLPLDGVMWPCRITRRRGSEIGVQFI